MAINGIDTSVLLGFYQARLSASPSSLAAANTRATALATLNKNSATANDDPPWNTPFSANAKQDAKVLSTTKYLDTSNVPLSAGATKDSKLEQDNQKLFSLYTAVNTLAYLAKMAQKTTATSGQLAGLNARFQTGMAEVTKYLGSTDFNSFNLQVAKPSDSVTSTASIAFGDFTYATRQLVTNAQINEPMAGVSASDSFTISVKKGSTTTDVAVNFSEMTEPLTLNNVISFINQKLSDGGFSTRFQKTTTGETATSSKNATYGMKISPGGVEQISLSAVSKPSLYMVGNSGIATETNTVTNAETKAVTTTAADQAGRLTKLTGLDGAITTAFSVTQKSATGITSAQASVVDGSGNIYVVGNATGDFANQINQGTQDAYLTKYDSAGNVVWQKLLGSAGTASTYGLALDPSGGVVVTGATTADVVPEAVADGNNDSYVARYTANGDQSWIRQIPTLAANQSNTVSVDASGNVYIGGSVSGGVIGGGQTSLGKGDAFLAKYDSKGKLLAETQFGTSAFDSVSATTTGSDGSLYVASVQNGHAIVARYANGDISAAPAWTQDLGTLSAGGSIGGIAVSNGKVYVSGATSNGDLNAAGSATVVNPASGGIDAFVFTMTDNGASATPNTVTYVGTTGTDTGGGLSVASDGTVYLAGSTTGTLPGAQRNVQGVNNAFVAAIKTDGSVDWTKQFGGSSGVSTGTDIAIDTNGSSVLDALGLPRGTINRNPSVELTNQTTLRAGSSFKIQIEGVAARTATITIEAGETFDSLATKINAQLGGIGKAKVNYTGGGSNLKLTVNAGQTITLVSGPKDFDALARLGITPGVLTAPSKDGSVKSSSVNVQPTYGLGLTGTLDISSRTGANMARTQLLAALSAIQSTYQTANKPETVNTTVGNVTGKATAYQTAQLSSYNLALALLGGS